eukprot:m.4549 g.4549  ORF g.4549 m.4549 type:complete len:58 (+) comp2249_c0_seq1:1245-1418(+)
MWDYFCAIPLIQPKVIFHPPLGVVFDSDLTVVRAAPFLISFCWSLFPSRSSSTAAIK